MKVQTLSTLVLTVAALLGGFLAFQQRSHLGRLKVEAAESAAQPGRAPVPGELAIAAGSASSKPESREPEKLELLRLRGEVTRLRQQVRELAGIRTEHERLRASLGIGGGSGSAPPAGRALGTGVALPSPTPYLRRQDAQFAGFGSPEATLQSLFWAIEHRDTNALFAAFVEGEAPGLREGFKSEDAEQHWEQLRLMHGFRVLSTEPVSPDEAVLNVEFLPGEPAVTIRLVRQGDAWRAKN